MRPINDLSRSLSLSLIIDAGEGLKSFTFFFSQSLAAFVLGVSPSFANDA
jgi:hypothetical protein